jgi:CspA family cold shock protein
MSAPSNVSVDSSASRHVGCVKWFDNRKGFGFINNLSNNSEVFVHHTGLNSKENCFRTLFPGEYIEYHLYHDDQSNRDYAVNVTGVQGGCLLCENTGTRLSVRRQHEPTATTTSTTSRPPREPREPRDQEGGFRKVERRGGSGAGASRGRGGASRPPRS